MGRKLKVDIIFNEENKFGLEPRNFYIKLVIQEKSDEKVRAGLGTKKIRHLKRE